MRSMTSLIGNSARRSSLGRSDNFPRTSAIRFIVSPWDSVCRSLPRTRSTAGCSAATETGAVSRPEVTNEARPTQIGSLKSRRPFMSMMTIRCRRGTIRSRTRKHLIELFFALHDHELGAGIAQHLANLVRFAPRAGSCPHWRHRSQGSRDRRRRIPAASPTAPRRHRHGRKPAARRPWPMSRTDPSSSDQVTAFQMPRCFLRKHRSRIPYVATCWLNKAGMVPSSVP